MRICWGVVLIVYLFGMGFDFGGIFVCSCFGWLVQCLLSCLLWLVWIDCCFDVWILWVVFGCGGCRGFCLYLVRLWFGAGCLRFLG